MSVACDTWVGTGYPIIPHYPKVPDSLSHQVDLKPLLNTACANIFNAYFCSVARRNYDDPILNEYCTDFDKVLLWDVSHQQIRSKCFDCPAVLGGEQRESNGCAALAGPCHELCSRRGSKTNQQVTNARGCINVKELIAFLPQHPQLCHQRNCGTPAEGKSF